MVRGPLGCPVFPDDGAVDTMGLVRWSICYSHGPWMHPMTGQLDWDLGTSEARSMLLPLVRFFDQGGSSSMMVHTRAKQIFYSISIFFSIPSIINVPSSDIPRYILSYLWSFPGYSVTTLSDGSTEYFVAGAPRSNHSGQVIVYTVNTMKQSTVIDTERGKQVPQTENIFFMNMWRL